MNCTPMVFKEKLSGRELTVSVFGTMMRDVDRQKNPWLLSKATGKAGAKEW
ncbi:hypothetical protein [Acidovorax sp. HMWF029]|uniref:hypothetical protein n=1 Tax=Acidovorax sp. HMWF029 TaxID=2056863 RepID=UPI0018EE4C40|nr:hypothetical protein [Acidovorax sp. HMWF029]